MSEIRCRCYLETPSCIVAILFHIDVYTFRNSDQTLIAEPCYSLYSNLSLSCPTHLSALRFNIRKVNIPTMVRGIFISNSLGQEDTISFLCGSAASDESCMMFLHDVHLYAPRLRRVMVQSLYRG